MRYEITDDTQAKREQLRRDRQVHLYASLYKDIAAILKLLMPNDSDKAMIAGQHLKSMMYALVELKTGKKASKF